MKLHHLTAEESLRSLGSRAEGLTAEEASRRLAEFGPNEVSRLKQEPLTHRLLRQFTHFFALVLWVAAALAFTADWKDPGHGMATLGWAILGVILINGLFSFLQEYRAERAISSLRRLLPARVKVVREGVLEDVPAAGLVPGEVLLLEEGDQVPADCRVLETHAARVNTATLTGESVPELVEAGPATTEDWVRSPNLLLAGTFLTSGSARALVFATGVAVELALLMLIVYTPWGQLVFGTAALPASVWLFTLPFAGGMLLLEELRKAWVRRTGRAPGAGAGCSAAR